MTDAERLRRNLNFTVIVENQNGDCESRTELRGVDRLWVWLHANIEPDKTYKVISRNPEWKD